MALVINAQLASFVEFARLQTNDKAIARVGVAAGGDGPLAGRTITAATRDKVAPIGPRSGDDKRANNAARELFREAVFAMFGGRENLPPKVAAAMKFGSDYRGAVILSGNMAVETGGVSEAQQADYILRALPVAAKHGVERFVIYALRNSERNPHDREDHFGIVHADFSPKPAFLALRDFRRRQDCGGPLSGSRQAP